MPGEKLQQTTIAELDQNMNNSPGSRREKQTNARERKQSTEKLAGNKGHCKVQRQRKGCSSTELGREGKGRISGKYVLGRKSQQNGKTKRENQSGVGRRGTKDEGSKALLAAFFRPELRDLMMRKLAGQEWAKQKKRQR